MTRLDWKISKALRRMQRRRERHTAMRIACKLSAVVLLMGAAVMFSGAADADVGNKATVLHTVKKGETLWSIAEAHCGDTYIMQYMDTLKKNNPALIEHKGQIYPGQVIKLVKE